MNCTVVFQLHCNRNDLKPIGLLNKSNFVIRISSNNRLCQFSVVHESARGTCSVVVTTKTGRNLKCCLFMSAYWT